MNRELLTKLYNEAVEHCVSLGPNPDGTNRAWVWEEKFAELIIRECINVHIDDYGIDIIGDVLMEHFGVKE
jgi:hypothetical protein